MKTFIDKSLTQQKVFQFQLGSPGHNMSISYFDYYRAERPLIIDIIADTANTIITVNKVKTEDKEPFDA